MSRSAEDRFLEGYDPDNYVRPSVTADLVIFTVIDSDLKVLLIRRGAHPFKGTWALPGGFVGAGDGDADQGEDLEEAAHRELAEETGLPRGSCYLEQLYTFGRAGRDPRMRVITIAWYALVRPDMATVVAAGDDADDVQWFSVAEEVPWMRLAFDHAEILAMGVQRIRGKIDYSDIAFELVPHSFTVAELRSVHETIQDKTHDARNFRRRFQRMVTDGIIVEAPGKRHRGKARPARVWRFNRST